MTFPAVVTKGMPSKKPAGISRGASPEPGPAKGTERRNAASSASRAVLTRFQPPSTPLSQRLVSSTAAAEGAPVKTEGALSAGGPETLGIAIGVAALIAVASAGHAARGTVHGVAGGSQQVSALTMPGTPRSLGAMPGTNAKRGTLE